MTKPKRNPSLTDEKAPGKLIRFLDWALIIVLGCFTIIVAIGYFLPVKELPEAALIPDGGAIKIQLFGGCGRSDEVMRAASLLRTMGIDVVDIQKESGQLYPNTLIIDRTGRLGVADSVARILGVPRDRIVLQRYDLLVDATVVLGLDYIEILKKLDRGG